MGYVLFLFYILLGVINARLILGREKPTKICWAGGVAGLVFLMWSHVPFSFLFGFGILSHILGFCAVVLWTVILYAVKCRRLPRIGKLPQKFYKPDKEEIFMLAAVAIMSLYCILCLSNHTLQEIDGAYYTGQCTYGDMNFHLGIITSIKEQGTFPPEYNIFPGQRLDYYFLSNSISCSLYLFGCSLKASYMLPMIFAFVFTFAGMWNLAYAVLKRVSKTLTAFILFFFNGGFGLFYFLDGLKAEGGAENFKRIFTAYYETPTNYVNSGQRLSNICWTNTVVDMMLPQRATLFGWMVLFLVLYLLYNAVFEDRNELFLAAGILGGLLPMIQTYSYFTLGLTALVWILYSCFKNRFRKSTLIGWLKFGIPAVLLAVPQFYIWIFGAVSEERFLRFQFNAYNATDNWLWFWVKNVGIVFILLLPAFLHAEKRLKIVHAAGALIFLVSECIVFQTHAYDNNKLYLIWYLFAVLLVANFLVDCYDKMRDMKAARVIIAAMLLVVCTASAFFTMVREYKSGQKGNAYMLYSKDDIAGAEFINENTEPGALFLAYNNHNNTVSCLTGRNIFTGSGTFLYSHGVDYNGRAAIVKSMFTDAEAFEKFRAEYAFDYIFLSAYERNNYPGLIEDYFQAHFPVLFEQGGIKIYDIR